MGGSSRKIRALAPLQGELSAQLTEGFRLGPQDKPRRRGSFWAEAFFLATFLLSLAFFLNPMDFFRDQCYTVPIFWKGAYPI